jgi:hypothetical protein
MWIFTTRGFFSVVENRENNEQVLIRARVKSDIQEMHKVFFELGLKAGNVAENFYSDYMYRFVAERMDWISVMEHLMLDLRYTNFKDAVYMADPMELRERRHNTYLKVWSDMRQLQSFDSGLNRKANNGVGGRKKNSKKPGLGKGRNKGFGHQGGSGNILSGDRGES